MVIKAVFFDMDGTIVDSEDVHTAAVQETIKKNVGIDLTREEIEEYVGLSYSQKLKRIFKKRNIQADIFRLDKLAVEKSVELSDLVKKIEGSEEVIQNIKSNFKVAVVTGSSREQANAILESSGLKENFDTIVTSSDVSRNKPYPDSYLLAAERLEVESQQCAVIEDSETGIKASKGAGMYCIIVKNRFNKDQDLSGADVLVESIDKITVDLIKSLE
jgi:HAD superfamily hydrolase (TIGR01509 family)